MRLTFWNDRKGHFDWHCENNEIADKLAAYEDAEEQGRLVILPCKVGGIECKRWTEGRTMYEELVKRLREYAKEHCPLDRGSGICGCIDAREAADAIEELSKPRTGVWITPRKNYCKCSVCGTGFHHSVGYELDNFCAECGAKMKGKIEMRKIDACPYCGCEEAYVESYEHHVGAIRYRVCCPKCGVYLDSGYWQTADRAIEEWNKRSNSMWWIPTKKQYPFAEYGEGNSVLTVDSAGEKRVLYYDGGNWCWPSGEVLETAREFPITHWMPLPEPPEEEA